MHLIPTIESYFLSAGINGYASFTVKEGNMDVSHELLPFLKNWLTKRIMGVDQKYVSFLKGEMEQ